MIVFDHFFFFNLHSVTDGDAIMKMIAAIIPMKSAVKIINAKMEHSNAHLVIALRPISIAMATEIAEICQTRQTVHRASQAAAIVLNHDSNAIIIYVLPCQIFAMELMIAVIIRMRRLQYVPTSIAIHCVDSR